MTGERDISDPVVDAHGGGRENNPGEVRGFTLRDDTWFNVKRINRKLRGLLGDIDTPAE
jgi:hypothetical protein